jgi:hypothetical protein
MARTLARHSTNKPGSSDTLYSIFDFPGGTINPVAIKAGVKFTMGIAASFLFLDEDEKKIALANRRNC